MMYLLFENVFLCFASFNLLSLSKKQMYNKHGQVQKQ